MNFLIIAIFVTGYAAIALEKPLRINKAASALLTGVLVWTVFIFANSDKDFVAGELRQHLGNLSGILFFLMGAMAIVELIDAHDGFELITRRIQTSNKRRLLWIIGLLTFFLSAVLDNMTTAIVMAAVIRKLLSDRGDRMFFVGLVVIAANAGGAWSPIGDVTTTMLWIGGQITSAHIIARLFIPSVVCLLVPLAIASFLIKGARNPPVDTSYQPRTSTFERNFVFATGISVLLLVPVFKAVTQLPPYMGILFGLGILWLITEQMHHEKALEEKHTLSVAQALRNIDAPSILFFLGILLAISVLETTRLLQQFAAVLDQRIHNQSVVIVLIGLLSAIVDNVPLVAATMGMYDLKAHPANSQLWEFVAYCAGTGGSILIIGTAAGVAAMGIEKIDFLWYLKRVGWLAALGFFAGVGTFMLQEHFLGR